MWKPIYLIFVFTILAGWSNADDLFKPACLTNPNYIEGQPQGDMKEHMCPFGSTWSQRPFGPDDSWTAYASDIHSTGPYRNYDNFVNVVSDTALRFWGITAYPDGGYWPCTENPMPFIITFYADTNNAPAWPIATYYDTLLGVPTDYEYYIYTLYEYNTIFNPPPPLTGAPTWLSIEGEGDPECWFLWMGSDDIYDDTHYSWDGSTLDDKFGDLSFCLSSEIIGITLDSVAGLTPFGDIMTEEPITFYIRASNISGYNVNGFTHGFEISSPDDAVWEPLAYDTTNLDWSSMFDLIVAMTEQSNDGSGADTVGFGAAAMMGSGFSTSFDEVVFTISTYVDMSQVGKTLCLDSCFYGTTGSWLWSTGGGPFYPDWDGPHCFEIVEYGELRNLKIFLVETESRWMDYTGENFDFGFLDFIADTTVRIINDSVINLSFSWDADAAGYPDLYPANAMVIAILFDTEAHQGDAYTPHGDYFDAYYAEAAAAATPLDSGYNGRSSNYTHPVFIELGSTTWAEVCGNARIVLKQMYEDKSNFFLYTTHVFDSNSVSYDRMFNDLNIQVLPYFVMDGGYLTRVGAIGDLDEYYNQLKDSMDLAGTRSVPHFGLDLSTDMSKGLVNVDTRIYMESEYQYDFGDLPDSYNTTQSNSGARHVITSNVYLGNNLDSEPDGQPSNEARADDNYPFSYEDEDGVIILEPIYAGNSAIPFRVKASVAGYLGSWIDFNNDGNFDGAYENQHTIYSIIAGNNLLTINAPYFSYIGPVYGRIRFSTDITGTISSFGPAADGEVEDYRFFVLEPLEDIVWQRLPELDNTGMDVHLSNYTDYTNNGLADDFSVIEAGLITDVHFWASYMDDRLPMGGIENHTFQISIYSDIPAELPYDWSRPGDLLWSKSFGPGEYQVAQITENNPADYYYPLTGEFFDNNHREAYQFDFFIDAQEALLVDANTIYWLRINDSTGIEPDYRLGWKTSRIEEQWNDNAVWLGDPPGLWTPMAYPPEHTHEDDAIDLALAISATPASPCDCEPGEMNADGVINIFDVTGLISYLYMEGAAPVPYELCNGDPNKDCTCNIFDITYLIGFLYLEGPPPCTCGEWTDACGGLRK